MPFNPPLPRVQDGCSESEDLAFYKGAWDNAVEVLRQIAERVGMDTTVGPPEGIYSVLHAVDDYIAALPVVPPVREPLPEQSEIEWILKMPVSGWTTQEKYLLVDVLRRVLALPPEQTP